MRTRVLRYFGPDSSDVIRGLYRYPIVILALQFVGLQWLRWDFLGFDSALKSRLESGGAPVGGGPHLAG